MSAYIEDLLPLFIYGVGFGLGAGMITWGVTYAITGVVRIFRKTISA